MISYLCLPGSINLLTIQQALLGCLQGTVGWDSEERERARFCPQRASILSKESSECDKQGQKRMMRKGLWKRR